MCELLHLPYTELPLPGRKIFGNMFMALLDVVHKCHRQLDKQFSDHIGLLRLHTTLRAVKKINTLYTPRLIAVHCAKSSYENELFGGINVAVHFHAASAR